MTLGEFKAWLEGYECSFIGKAPTAYEYEMIWKKLSEVSTSIPSASKIADYPAYPGPVITRPSPFWDHRNPIKSGELRPSDNKTYIVT